MLVETGAKQFAENLEFPLRHLRDHEDQGRVYPYGFTEIDEHTMPLGIPWERSKDVPFKLIVILVGFTWDLGEKRVSLPEAKKGKYTQAIVAWKLRETHTLEDMQKLYGKLLYTCHIIPQGRAYLNFFKKMMALFHKRPFIPRRPPKRLEEDLRWWQNTFAHPSLSREIPGNRQIIDIHGFSDTSSTTGLGIVLGNQWRAWRLLPGWQDQGCNIGWAEAVATELLIRSVLQHQSLSGLKICGDNNGVVEGWWTGRSRNVKTNRVFKRLHLLLEEHDTVLSTRYVNTSRNPADGPSQGIYPPRYLLLPQVELPIKLEPFIVDFDTPLQIGKRSSPHHVPPEPKFQVHQSEWIRRQQVNRDADEQSDTSLQTLPLNRKHE